MYKVIYSADYLDSKPSVCYFDFWHELEDYLFEEVKRRVHWTVEHSPYQVSEEDLKSFEEVEWTLIQILEGDNVKEMKTIKQDNLF
tara:strand:+ start:2761 stop:3018 length:258 start_codon:yes stop_codon:yes gene_type:complete